MNQQYGRRWPRIGLVLAAGCGALAGANSEAATARPPSLAMASREQLRACMNTEDEMKAARGALDRRGQAHTAALAEIQAAAGRVVEQQKAVDNTQQTQVDGFNLLVAAHNDTVTAENARGAQLGADSDAFNARMLAYNQRCSTLVYRLKDRDAIVKERQGAKN